ncbi:MAG: hypothetical protein ACI8UG_002215 [Gammaproteobacteria bacterium]|jgi:hypothetical protein
MGYIKNVHQRGHNLDSQRQIICFFIQTLTVVTLFFLMQYAIM